MSLLKTFQTYQSLSTDQKHFVKDKFIESTAAPEQWLALFRKIAEYDRYRDASSSKFAAIGCGCGLLAFIGFFISVASIYSFLLYLLVVIPAIVVLIFIGRQRKDVPNHLRQFVIPMLAVLREEMEAQEPLYIRLDLRDGTTFGTNYSNQLSAGGQRLQRAGSKITEAFYAHYWLLTKGTLQDGTRIEIQLLDRIRKRSEGKRRTSGKYKTKTKYKIKTRIDTALQFKKSRYALKQEKVGSQGGEAVEMKANDSRHIIKVRRNAISTDLKTPVGVDRLFHAIARAYRQVTPS